MKKLFTLGFMTFFVMIFLVGCGNESTEITSDEPLTVWAMGYEGEQLPKMAEQFTEETGIEVEVLAIPWDQAHDKLLTAVASQEGPDVVQLGTSWIAEFAEAGALADLSVYAEEYPETFGTSEYFPGTEGYMYYEGTMVTVPWYVDTRVLFYRTDLLAEVGYTEPPATWEELYDCASKLVGQGVSEYGIQIYGADLSFYEVYSWSYGWTFFDENGNLNFDDPVFQESIEYYNSFFEAGLSPLDNSTDVMVGFSSGTIPMFFSGPWMVSVIQNDYPELEGKWAVAPVPAGDIQTSVLGGANWCIWEWSDQKDEAAQFIDWMNQPEQQVEWFEICGVLPSKISAWEDPILADSPYLEVFETQLYSVQAAPLIPELEAISMAILVEADNYYFGKQDIETTMTNIVEVANKEYAD